MLVCATRNAQQPERTPTQEYYDSVLKLQSDLDNRIAEHAGAGTGIDSTSKLLKGLTLLAAMVGHSFDPTHIPNDLSDMEYPFCGECGVLIAEWEQHEKTCLSQTIMGIQSLLFPQTSSRRTAI